MDWALASSFRLIENGTGLSPAALEEELRKRLHGRPPAAAVVVRGTATTSVVLGLIAALRSHPVYLMRDPSAPPFALEVAESHTDWLFGLKPSLERPALWLQTSGTTGRPKWVAHSPAQLLQAVSARADREVRWLLTYDPASFAGLQVILTALRGGQTLVARPSNQGVDAMVDLAARHGVTHVSGTPTFWRAFLRTAGSAGLPLQQITLGGELADAATLALIRTRFPAARVRHIYATTETGVVFSVQDGQAGFPAQWLGQTLPNGARLALSDRQTLVVHSPLSSRSHGVQDIDTGDLIEVRGERALFMGRADSLINVGGHKVFPEDVEGHLLNLAQVSDARVTAQASPITGAVLTVDIVPAALQFDPDALRQDIRKHLAQLPRHARPAVIRLVDWLPTNSTNKKARTA